MNYEMANEWLKAANYDLLVIKEIINNESLTTIASFHSQQLIEKSLKAVLELYDKEIPKIHSIKKLFDLTKDILPIVMDKELVVKIDSLYIDARYPGDFGLLPNGKPLLKEAIEFYEFARKVYLKASDIICGIK